MSSAKASPILSESILLVLRDKLMDSIHEVAGCWVWAGVVDKDHYAKVHVPTYGRMPAHRASYLVFKGIIPKGISVKHACNTPACINPGHLLLCDGEENSNDFKHLDPSLKMEIALKMSDMRCLGYSISEVAKPFKCSIGTVYALTEGLANTIEERLNLRNEGR